MAGPVARRRPATTSFSVVQTPQRERPPRAVYGSAAFVVLEILLVEAWVTWDLAKRAGLPLTPEFLPVLLVAAFAGVVSGLVYALASAALLGLAAKRGLRGHRARLLLGLSHLPPALLGVTSLGLRGVVIAAVAVAAVVVLFFGPASRWFDETDGE